jgi:hypothetical protein
MFENRSSLRDFLNFLTRLHWIEIQRYKMIRPYGTLHIGESFVPDSSENIYDLSFSYFVSIAEP